MIEDEFTEMIPMFTLGDEVYDAPLLPEFECRHGGWMAMCPMCRETWEADDAS